MKFQWKVEKRKLKSSSFILNSLSKRTDGKSMQVHLPRSTKKILPTPDDHSSIAFCFPIFVRKKFSPCSPHLSATNQNAHNAVTEKLLCAGWHMRWKIFSGFNKFISFSHKTFPKKERQKVIQFTEDWRHWIHFRLEWIQILWNLHGRGWKDEESQFIYDS